VPKNPKVSNETKNVIAQCKVLVYPWNEVLTDPNISDDKLAGASRLDISSQLQTVTFSKNMGSAAGSFSFTLTNSPNYGTNDWKDIIKRGCWCVIYMSNDGKLQLSPQVALVSGIKSESKYIRCIGYIERVSVIGSTNENRAVDISFQVSGSDFGVIYDQTNIWHNLFVFDKIMLDNVAQTSLNVVANTPISKAIKLIHDMFYYPAKVPGAKPNDNKSLLSIALQWLLPKEMVSDIGFDISRLSGGTYWGALDGVFQISETLAGIAVDKPGDYLTGNAWAQLKRMSIPQFHELFCETDLNGKPRLIFRPIPWGIDQSKYPKNSKNITLYKDLKPVVTVPAVDLYTFDLGEDNHARYNSFLTMVSSSYMSVETNVNLIDGFPKNNQDSIKRHGFRPYHNTINSLLKNEELANGAAHKDQLIEFNEINYDYWNNGVYAESGTVTKLGTNDIKIGHVMKFSNDINYLASKRYYIEGYTDTFTVGANLETSWSQTVDLTRGFEEADLANKKGFSNRNVEFADAGEFTTKK
jgi:hypothetical protein